MPSESDPGGVVNDMTTADGGRSKGQDDPRDYGRHSPMSGRRKKPLLLLAGVDRNEVASIVAEVAVSALLGLGKQFRSLD